MFTIAKTANVPSPKQPEYHVLFAPELELWVVSENDKAIAYCPEKVYAWAVACALRFLRSEVIHRADAIFSLVRPVRQPLNN